MPDTKPYDYDVFISHSIKDKPIVLELANRLKDDGLKVWLDDWEIQPGDLIGLKIEQGLENSRVLLLCMSANAFGSEWVTLERHTVLFRDPTNRERRFIPLRLDDSPIPDMIGQFANIDWRHSTAEQYSRLKASLIEHSLEIEPQESPSGPPPVRALEETTGSIESIAITLDSKRIVSGSADSTIQIWDIDSGKCLTTLEGHTEPVIGIAVTPNGKQVVSGSVDKTVRIWDIDSGKCLTTLEGHTESVFRIAVTPNGKRIVSGSVDSTIRIWDIDSGKCLTTLEGHTAFVFGIAVTPNGKRIVSGSLDSTIRIWDVDSGECLTTLEGHTGIVYDIAVTPNGKRIVSGSADMTIRIWDIDSGKCLTTLEGHINTAYSIAITPNGKRIVSGSDDTTIRIWDIDSGKCLTTLEGHTGYVNGIAITPNGKQIVSGSDDRTIRVWDFPEIDTEDSGPTPRRFTNAKVLLVGDSGVGKSGLAMRLVHDKFEQTISTDGVTSDRISLSDDEWATRLQLSGTETSGDTEREIWLWDFAGQSDYRLTHQLFMDDTSLAAYVFNPQSDNPFEGLGQWDRDLRRAARRPFAKLLVAGRCDRGSLTVSQRSMEEFRQENAFAGYYETSALTGEGCGDLRKAILENIDWEAIPWTSSPRIFKLLKDKIVELKDEGKTLLRLGELKQQLDMRLPKESFTFDELRAVTGLLSGPGIVWNLEFGEFVLLQPEIINAYAAAAIRKVRSHIDELGFLAEDDLLAGRLDFQDRQRLPEYEEQTILRALHQTFVQRGFCLREPAENGPLLVFPSYFKRNRPDQNDHPAACVTYRFSGQLDDIYATLVVRLHHTPIVEKDRLWRYAADFKTPAGKRAGLKMTRQPEGAAELTVYFGPDVPDDTKILFTRFIHDHLNAKAQDVSRERHYVCPHCDTPAENRNAIRKRIERGETDILCTDCEKRFEILDVLEQKFASDEARQRVRELEERAQIVIDNESRELILVGHAFAIAGEAGQIFRPTPNSDWGIDGEIEFKNDKGEASGERVYLQLKSGDSYLHDRKTDKQPIFRIKDRRHAEYWSAQKYPVMLVIRTSDGQIRWMNATEYIRRHGTDIKQIEFDGEPFTAINVSRLRRKLIPLSNTDRA